ncbi:hypothetical protein CDG68_00640 (plasmid) [Acinetobacter wuhouensis]|uniref:Uncharacterized protein n=1 Tax=Acinetobacter wuhouensis TaxID=1879050 RepID=A0A3G2SWT4_9GAMM|nr:hypothetical protein CDG68_00640 [Acinetobacter wuhouensis]
MADLIVHLGLLKPWSIAQEVSVEREKSQKKPTLGKVGYQLETTALISKWNYNAFRIRCIMLILGKFKNLYAMVYSIFFDFLSFRLG